MGHVYVKATFYNISDYMEHVSGRRTLKDVRQIHVDALVDTGATYPALPEDIVKEIGLSVIKEAEGETAQGKEALKLTATATQIEDRTAISYTIVRPKKTTPLIGVVALEQMGYKIDPSTGKLIKGLPLML